MCYNIKPHFTTKIVISFLNTFGFLVEIQTGILPLCVCVCQRLFLRLSHTVSLKAFERKKKEAGGHGTRLKTVSNKAIQSGGTSSLASWTYLQHMFEPLSSCPQ